MNDFWQMVWEQDCATIVMLTTLEEDGTVSEHACWCTAVYTVLEVLNDLAGHVQEMCSQYWPSTGSTTYGKFTVSLERIVPGVDYNIRKFKLSLVTRQSLLHGLISCQHDFVFLARIRTVRLSHNSNTAAGPMRDCL